MKYVFFILITLFSENSNSQDIITIANTFLNDQNYAEAKIAIDEAFSDSDVSSNPRAWYTKARVYHEILKSADKSTRSIIGEQDAFLGQVITAYQKTQELTPKTNNLHILATNQMELLWGEGINNGYTKFQEGKFKEALNSFNISKIVKPRDTIAYLNAAISAQNAGMYVEALSNYQSLKNLTRLSKSAYNGMIICKQLLKAPFEQQLEVVEEALFEYPSYVPYAIQEVRLLVRLNRLDAAESVLNTALKRNPNSAVIIIRRADLYDRIFKAAYLVGKPEKSERYFDLASSDYERYINSFPNDFTANYNYAVMINEQANRVYVRINLMSKEEYEIRGKEAEQFGHDWTRKAVSYMERANTIKPGDSNVKKALGVFYERLKMDEKLAVLNNGGN